MTPGNIPRNLGVSREAIRASISSSSTCELPVTFKLSRLKRSDGACVQPSKKQPDSQTATRAPALLRKPALARCTARLLQAAGHLDGTRSRSVAPAAQLQRQLAG